MNNRLSCNREALLRATNARWSSAGIFACALGTFLFGILPAPVAAASDAPAWMHALTNAPLPPHDDKTDAVILYSEEILIVQPNGKIKEIDRAAYKILRPSGRSLGKQYFSFDRDTRITDVHGWCIPAQGKDYEVKEKDMLERGMVDEDAGMLFTDLRSKIMDIPAADPGNIIGFEIVHEDRPYILQDEWAFQSRLPVADARYTLQLPQGWEYKAVWVNHSELSPASVGNNQWQWQLKNIPEIKREEDMPPWTGVAGLMIVALIPPGGANHGFLNWSEMGTWYTGLLQDRKLASPEIKKKVADLTAGASTPLDKMRALAQFVQKDIRYVAIELGIGGWQPHPARDVFAQRYGDCKDKATLLSSMLKEIGIDSYHVVIHTNRGAVTPALPPHIGAFNHAILAIQLPAAVNDPSLVATIQHPKLGRLLFFDPTDELTPFGDLRGELQANYALLVTPDGGELTPLPQLASAASGVNRKAKFQIAANGTLTGEVTEIHRGDSAMIQRYRLKSVTKDADRIKPIETVLAHSLGTFQITKANVGNQLLQDQPLHYMYDFTAVNYAKAAGNLFLVRPRVLGILSSDLLERKDPRKYPVEFEGPAHDADTYEIELPPGYVVDELPPPIDADYSFASYHSKTQVQGNTLVYSRTYEIKELSVPVEKLDQLKTLYRAIAGDERNTAVLKPKGT